ncbi:MAG TPA: glycosyl transferase, partial [Syntrophobacteraceae bacterium]|nr:glycosyl transferase [Syntrophobacteraceae bacterium]
SVVIPCYNEEATLEKCVHRVRAIQDATLQLEIIIVDDASRDKSLAIARSLAADHPEIRVLHHEHNQGKGAALRNGFQSATGDYVAVQDADLEYDPQDLKRLLVPLKDGIADVVFGSRFLSHGTHRVLYFWHSLGNAFLTFLSNMFTDLNLTDMETCYKVFRREVIQSITLKEDRFGIEPELVAKVAQMRLRIYEMGISYYGRTYEEGKKIGVKDGFRALYCIFHYNAHRAPLPIQFVIYALIGGVCALVNVAIFLFMFHSGVPVIGAAPIAYGSAAALNYFLCIHFLFRHRARWTSVGEVLIYLLVVIILGLADLWMTQLLLAEIWQPWLARSATALMGLVFNFLGRKYLVFPEPAAGPWKA